jgi:hypothetical protein
LADGPALEVSLQRIATGLARISMLLCDAMKVRSYPKRTHFVLSAGHESNRGMSFHR